MSLFNGVLSFFRGTKAKPDDAASPLTTAEIQPEAVEIAQHEPDVPPQAEPEISLPPLPEEVKTDAQIEPALRVVENRAGADGAFTAFMDGVAAPLGGRWSVFDVAGVSHQNRDGTSRQSAIRSLKPRAELNLIPEPDNPVDPNAVAIFTDRGLQIGHVPAAMAAEITANARLGVDYRGFVMRVISRQGPYLRVAAAILKYRPDGVAVPISPLEFDRTLRLLAERNMTGWKTPRLIGLTKKNDDQSVRRELWKSIRCGEFLKITDQVFEDGRPVKVRLHNRKDQILAELERAVGLDLVKNHSAGGGYAAIFRDLTEDDTGVYRPNVVLLGPCSGNLMAGGLVE